MRSLKNFLRIVTFLIGITSCIANSEEALEKLCHIYTQILGGTFYGEISYGTEWDEYPDVPGSEYGCGSKQFTKEGIKNTDQEPVCMKFRLDKIFYQLKYEGHFNSGVPYKNRRYFLYLALRLSGDYEVIPPKCDITIYDQTVDIETEIYNEIVQKLGLIQKNGKYNTPSDQDCSSLLNIDFGHLTLREDSEVYSDLVAATQKTLKRHVYYPKSYITDKFAKAVSQRVDQIRATSLTCQVLKFAFVHSNFYLSEGKNMIKISLEDEQIKKVLKSSLTILATNVQDFGCLSEELRNYALSLLPFEPSVWYQQLQKITKYPLNDHILSNMYCDVMDVVVRVGEYLNMVDNKKRVVNAKLDYKTYIGLQEITGTIEQQFTKLGEYFVSIQNFNKEKSKKDMEFVEGRLKKFNSNLTSISEKVGAGVGLVLDVAFEQALGNLVAKAAKLALAYAEAANPLKTLFGGTTVSDITAATSDFVEADEQFKNSRQLKAALDNITKTLEKVQKGLQENKEVLDKAYKIVTQKVSLEGQDFEEIKAEFLQQYGDYDPAVDSNEIDLVGAQFETVVDSACDLIQNTRDIHNYVMKGGGPGVLIDWIATVPPDPCLSTKWDVSQMVSLLGEIFDFQNELMETCASHLRARIAEDKALLLTSTDKDSPVSKEFTREDILGMATIFHHIDRCYLIQEFCDVLEYRDGGIRPEDCVNSKPNIGRLLGSKARQKVEEFQLVNIPDIAANVSKNESIDIDRLMAGEAVSFQIPDFDWLQEHAPVHSSERHHDIFVKNVIIYAPYVTNGVTSPVISKAKASGEFELQQGSRSYVFGEPFSSTFKYDEGTRSLNCVFDLDPNQYTLCKTNPLDDTCPRMEFANKDCNDEDVRVLFPSIYSKWNLQLLGYEKTLKTQKLPVAKTKRSLKVIFIVCKFQSAVDKAKNEKKKGKKKGKKEIRKKGKKDNRKSNVPKPNTDRCCSASQYWDEEENGCRQCPTGSRQMLNGYYCGVDHPGDYSNTKKGASNKSGRSHGRTKTEVH